MKVQIINHYKTLCGHSISCGDTTINPEPMGRAFSITSASPAQCRGSGNRQNSVYLVELQILPFENLRRFLTTNRNSSDNMFYEVGQRLTVPVRQQHFLLGWTGPSRPPAESMIN